MNVSVILAAGGSSSRFGKDKLIEKINNEEVIIHTLKKFYNLSNVNEIVIVTAKHLIEIIKKLKSLKVRQADKKVFLTV